MNRLDDLRRRHAAAEQGGGPERQERQHKEGKLSARERIELLQGTLDLLILKSLQNEPMHGFGIAVRIGQMSKDMLTVEQGSLYPALYRLEEQGWIKAEWGVSDNNRKAKFYSLTAAGRKQLAREAREWNQTADLIAAFLTPRREA